MKINNKKYFVIGILILCALPLLTLGITEGKAMLWILGAAFASRYLYAGLSESGSTKQRHTDNKYERASEKVLGKHAAIKRWGPLILLGVFLVVSQNLLSAFDYLPPAGAVLAVFIISAVIFVYTIGVEIEIAKHIADEMQEKDSLKIKE